MKRNGKRVRLRVIVALVGVLSLAACSSTGSRAATASKAGISSFPTRTITVIVPFTAGAATDVAARVLAKSMSSDSGVSVIVKDVPGGGTVPGVAAMMSQPANGYTLLFATTTTLFAIAKGTLKAPLSDFDFVAQVLDQPFALVVASNRFKTLQAFLAYAKANPGHVSVAGIGPASPSSEFTGLLGRAAGVKLHYVPMQGGNQVTSALISGVADAGVGSISNFYQYVTSGKFRALFVGSKQPYPGLSGVPTETTTGFSDSASSWFGYLVKANTPSSVVAKLQDMVRVALRSNLWKKYLTSQKEQTDLLVGKQFADSAQADLQQIRAYLTTSPS